MSFETVDEEFIESLVNQDEEASVKAKEGHNSRGRIPQKNELNKMLITSIVRRLRKLYISVPKSEDRILIEEILDDLAQLMILNNIATELLHPPKKKEKK